MLELVLSRWWESSVKWLVTDESLKAGRQTDFTLALRRWMELQMFGGESDRLSDWRVMSTMVGLAANVFCRPPTTHPPISTLLLFVLPTMQRLCLTRLLTYSLAALQKPVTEHLIALQPGCTLVVNAFNVSCSKLLLFEGSSAILV